MKTLAVADGDLVLSGGDYYTIDGAARIKQDLTFALTDAYGGDPYHPNWGSILDRFIGLPISAGLQARVQAEVTRVINNYITVQQDQINVVIAQGTRSLFDASDVVSTVTSIDVTVDYDKITVAVSLASMTGESVSVTRQVTV